MPALVRLMAKPAERAISAAIAQSSASTSVSQASLNETISSQSVSGVPTAVSVPKAAAATFLAESDFSITLNSNTPSAPAATSSSPSIPTGGTVITQTQTIGQQSTPTQSTATVVVIVPGSSSSSSSVLVSTSATPSSSSTLIASITSTITSIAIPLSSSNTSPIPTVSPVNGNGTGSAGSGGNGNGTGSGNGNGKGQNKNHSGGGQTMGAEPGSAANGSASTPIGAATTSSVNPAVIAVPIVLVVLLFLAGGVFFVRRHFIQKRQRKRNTWGAGIYPRAPPPDFGVTEQNYEQARMANVAPNMLASVRSPAMALAPAPAPPLPAVYVSEPPASVREPSIISTLPTPTYPTASSPMSAVGGFGAGATVPTGAAARAGVKCSFVPSLPDELPIATGDQIQILAEYDDGWALCDNGRGEQGMVPLDCLERGTGPTTPLSVTSFAAVRSQRRVSSLAGAGVRG